MLSWYVVTSTVGVSAGNEASGRIIQYLQNLDSWTTLDAYHALFWVYTVMGLLNGTLVLLMTESCELDIQKQDYARVSQSEDDGGGDTNEVTALNGHNFEIFQEKPSIVQSRFQRIVGWLITSTLSQISASTRPVMYKMWFLLSIDSLADGMAPISLTTYYMDEKFHPSKSALGDVTSASYMLGAIASVFAGTFSRHFGLVNTMVFTHVPSSAAVLFFPFPSAFWMAAALLLVRMGLNNMDQAPRSAFIAAVVKPEERTAVMGITSTVRTLASMAGPILTGILAAKDQFWIAFASAGVFRLVYDFGLYAMFINMKIHPEEPKRKSVPNIIRHRQVHQVDAEHGLELQQLDDESDTQKRRKGP